MTTSDLVGSEWESKDGKRGLVVLRETSPWRGERQFLVKGTAGSTRERLIGYGGLRAKYRRRDAETDTAAELRGRLDEAEAVIARIREALAGHPRCDVHPDDDVISCGWKRAVASVQWALDTTEPTTQENPNV
ncbi:hypothetical protein [Nocardia sp. NPDC051833]|uniref:hypothetical protein n=1 Tax=Nocardia sp. NPDC051833 TaxID=3155674 RepID=UPI0034497833